MKKSNKILLLMVVLVALTIFMAVPAVAITTEEVEAHVQEVGRESATGNLFIWFLCAIAFLKASQKIDSLMSSLGISVGHTGGSMLSEALVAARGMGMAKGAVGTAAGGVGSWFGGKRGGAAGGAHTAGGATGGVGGGLAGVIGRKITNSAVQSVTTPAPAGHDGSAAASPATSASSGDSGQQVPTNSQSGKNTGAHGTQTGPRASAADTAPIPTAQGEERLDVGAPAAGCGGTSIAGGAEQMGDASEDSVLSPADLGGIGVDEAAVCAGASEMLDAQPEIQGGAPAEAAPAMMDTAAPSGYHPPAGGGVGRRIFERSLARGGDFATKVTGAVAMGSVANTGTMQGATAAAALTSYLGIGGAGASGAGRPTSGASGGAQAEGSHGAAASPPQEMPHTPIPSFANVEIGGGRITGIETSTDHPGGIPFAMYSADQYIQPEGEHESVTTKDGATWFKQYAQDTVERKPFKDEEGKIKYDEDIVKRMPRMPSRKDRV